MKDLCDERKVRDLKMGTIRVFNSRSDNDFIDTSCFLFVMVFGHMTQLVGSLVPRSGIEPMPPALEAWSLNH